MNLLIKSLSTAFFTKIAFYQTISNLLYKENFSLFCQTTTIQLSLIKKAENVSELLYEIFPNYPLLCKLNNVF